MLSLALWPIVLLVYLPALLSVDFIWDDFAIGTDPVRTLAGLRQIWFSPAAIPAEGHYLLRCAPKGAVREYRMR